MAAIKVVMTDHAQGQVFIDGHEVKGVRKLAINAGVNEANSVVITLMAAQVEFEGEVDLSGIGEPA